jgi:multiple sugar transport system substrate-binding protein
MIELRGITWNHVRGWGGLRAASDAYAAARGDVRVSWEARSLQSFAEQPVEELARYDLIVLDHPSVGEAVARGAIVALDEHLDRDLMDDQRSASVGRSFESYDWDGHQWALAVDAAAQVAAYRPDLLERAGLDVPRAWEDVPRAAAVLAERRSTIALPAIPVDAVCAFLAMCAAPFDDVNVVERGAGRRALTILSDVIEVAHPLSLEVNPPTLLASMAERDDVAYCPLAFGYVTYARDGPAAHALGFTSPPAMTGTLGGAGIAVSSGSAHVEEACAFVAFVTSANVQAGIYAAGGGQPGHRAAWTDPAVDGAANGFFSATLPALDAAYLRPRHDGYLSFQDTAGVLIHRYLRDGGDPDRVLDAIDRAARATRMSEVEG